MLINTVNIFFRIALPSATLALAWYCLIIKPHQALRPNFLFLLLVSLISGIFLQSFFAIPLPLVGLGIITSSLIALCVQDISQLHVLMPVFCLVGACIFQHQKNHAETLLLRYGNRPLTLHGTITNKEECAGIFKEQWRLDVHQIKLNSEKIPVSFNILCYSKKITDLAPSDTVSLNNVILKTSQTPSISDKPTFFDYLIKEDALCSLFVDHQTTYTLESRPTWSLNRWLWKQKMNLYHACQQKLSYTAFTYFSLIFLGNKYFAKYDSLRALFNQWGLAHFLARSGLHIVLFIFMWTFLLNLMPLPLQCKRFILLSCCFCYCMLSWISISFIRAFLVFVLTQLGAILSRQTNFLHLLTLTCLLILLFNPIQLFFLDFQLTFGLTFTLAWLARTT
ncbi:ComEC/Rec2 family competence protein [Candidatus Babeliales bacterium]|nr:ComEC/Rec2 family competence protein [Candidatus Babeliales bacterium]